MRIATLWSFPFFLTGALLSPFAALEIYGAFFDAEAEARWFALRNAATALLFAGPMLWAAWRIADSRRALANPPDRSRLLTFLAYAGLLSLQIAVVAGALALTR